MATYKEESNLKHIKKFEEVLTELPGFCREYFIGKELRLEPLTRLTYAYNLRSFFEYLQANNSYFGNKSIKDFRLDDMENLESDDIGEFLHWLRYHEIDGKVYQNKPETIEHYIGCLSSVWTFFVRRKKLSHNPVLAIDRMKRQKKKVIRLDGKEKQLLLSSVEYGSGLTSKQQAFHEKNKERDAAIVYVFLDTGVRVSELVGMNIKDIDFDNHYIGVMRKGNKYDQVYFSDVTEQYLQNYLSVRYLYKPVDDALFVNRDGNRISVRSIEKMIKKYVSTALPARRNEITPHKLRSTYATDMLAATGNIELVSNQLGHSNIQTTTIYAQSADEDKSKARNILFSNNQP